VEKIKSEAGANSPVPDKMSYCNGRYVRMANFAAKTENPMMIIGLLAGFFLCILPTIHSGFRQLLHEWPFFYAIFEASVWFKPIFIYPLLSFILLIALLAQLSKGFPGGWREAELAKIPTAKQVVDEALFPSSKKESIIFLYWFFMGFLKPYFWFSVFAVLSYFMMIGGVKWAA